MNSSSIVEIHVVLHAELQLRQADIILDFDIKVKVGKKRIEKNREFSAIFACVSVKP